jgi:hypothetical protein
MKHLAFLSLAVLTINVNGAARPNIILFVTDDQVKEELACYGGKGPHPAHRSTGP